MLRKKKKKKKKTRGRLQAWHFLWRSALTRVHLHQSCNWNDPIHGTGTACTWQLTWIYTSGLSRWLIPNLHILGGDSCTWNWFWKKVLDGRNPTEATKKSLLLQKDVKRVAGLLIVKLSLSVPTVASRLSWAVLNSKTLVKRRAIHLTTVSHKHT